MSYRVQFYREIVGNGGKPATACVYTAVVEAPASMDKAIAAAIAALKQDRGLPCWRELADSYEVTYRAAADPDMVAPAEDSGRPKFDRQLSGPLGPLPCAARRPV